MEINILFKVHIISLKIIVNHLISLKVKVSKISINFILKTCADFYEQFQEDIKIILI